MKVTSLMNHLVLAVYCVFLLSCTDKKDADIALIETIENNLLPEIIIEGEEDQRMNIYDRMECYHVPGVSIAFQNKGEIVWAKGYGYTSADSARVVDENTLFQAASISKPIAAMAALALVEEGKIGLDEDLNLYLNSWQVEENKFTVKEKVVLSKIGMNSSTYEQPLPETFWEMAAWGHDVAIMTNGDRGGELISEILRSFSKVYNWEGYQPEVKSTASLSKEELEAFTGENLLSIEGQELLLGISIHDNHLKGVQLWNDFSFEIYAESATRFFNRDDGAEFEFSLDDNGAVIAITVFEYGQEYRFTKI